MGTITLAALTAWYVFLTGRLSREATQSAASAAKSAQAAEEAVALARHQMMLEQMPRLTLLVEGSAARSEELQSLWIRAYNGGRSRAVEVEVRVVGGLAGDKPMPVVGWSQLLPSQTQKSGPIRSRRDWIGSFILEALNDGRVVELCTTYRDDFGTQYLTRDVITFREDKDRRRASSLPSGVEFWDGDRWRSLQWTPGTQGGPA
jgi:hypothetical protein